MVGTRAKGIVMTLRPIVGIVTVPWTLAMGMLAASLNSTHFGDVHSISGSWDSVGLIVMAAYLGVTAGYALNDYFDFDLDARRASMTGGPPRPVRRRGDLLTQGAVLGAASLAIMLYLGPLTFVLGLAQVLCVLVYSALAKPRTPYANLLVVLAVAIMPMTIFSAFTTRLMVEAVALAAVNATFEPGFTWAGVLRDTPTDKALGMPTFPAIHGIKATAKLILVSWLLLGLATVEMYRLSDLGPIFLVLALVATLWLLGNAFRLVRRPEPEIGGATFLRATLWFWLFSLAIILDIVFHYAWLD